MFPDSDENSGAGIDFTSATFQLKCREVSAATEQSDTFAIAASNIQCGDTNIHPIHLV